MNSSRHRFDEIDQEQLAAQIIAVMDAHFQRPSPEEKRSILHLAKGQIEAMGLLAQQQRDRDDAESVMRHSE